MGENPTMFVRPKNVFDIYEIGFLKICALAGRLYVHATNIYIERVFLG